MKIRKKMRDAAITGTAYTMIGAEVARRNINKENARKVATGTVKLATASGRSLLHAARSAGHAVSMARDSVNARKMEILAASSDEDDLF